MVGSSLEPVLIPIMVVRTGDKAATQKVINEFKNLKSEVAAVSNQVSKKSKVDKESYSVSRTVTKGNKELLNTFNKTRTIIKASGADIQKYNLSMNLLGKQVTVTTKQVIKDATSWGGAFSGVTRQLNQLRWTMVNVTFALTAVAGLAYPFVQLAKDGMDWELQLTKIKMVTDDVYNSTDKLRGLSGFLKETRKGSPYSSEDVATGFLEFAKAGFGAKEAEASIGDIIKLATAGATTIESAGKIMSATMHAFIGEAMTSAEALDLISSAANKSALDVDSFGVAMAYASPVAAALGYSSKETASAVALLSNAGLAVSKSGTAVRQIFNKISQSGLDASGNLTEAAKRLERVGVSFIKIDKDGKRVNKTLGESMENLAEAMACMDEVERASLLVNIFQIRASQAASVFTGLIRDGQKGITEYSKTIGNAGYGADLFGQAMEANANILKDAMENLKDSAEPMATAFITFLTPVIDLFASLTRKANDLAEATDPKAAAAAMTGGALALGGAGAVGLGRVLWGAVKQRGSTPANPMYVKNVGILNTGGLFGPGGLLSLGKNLTTVGAHPGVMLPASNMAIIAGMLPTIIPLVVAGAATYIAGKSIYDTVTGPADPNFITMGEQNTIDAIAELQKSIDSFNVKDPPKTKEERYEWFINNANISEMYIKDMEALKVINKLEAGGTLPPYAPKVYHSQEEVAEDIVNQAITSGLTKDFKGKSHGEQVTPTLYGTPFISFAPATDISSGDDAGTSMESASDIARGRFSEDLTELSQKYLAKITDSAIIGMENAITDFQAVWDQMITGDKMVFTEADEAFKETFEGAIQSRITKYEGLIATEKEYQALLKAEEVTIKNHTNSMREANKTLKEKQEALTAVNKEIALLSKPRFTGQLEIERLMSDFERWEKEQNLADYGVTAQEYLQQAVGLTRDEYDQLYHSVSDVNNELGGSTSTFEAWQETVREFIRGAITEGNLLGTNVSRAVKQFSTQLLSTSKFSEDSTKGQTDDITLLRDAYDIYYGEMTDDVNFAIKAHQEEADGVYGSSQSIISQLQLQWEAQNAATSAVTDAQDAVDDLGDKLLIARDKAEEYGEVLRDNKIDMDDLTKSTHAYVEEQMRLLALGGGTFEGTDDGGSGTGSGGGSYVDGIYQSGEYGAAKPTPSHPSYVNPDGVLNNAPLSSEQQATYDKFYGDFVMRPGQGPVSFSPQDTLVGVKDTGLLGGGVTINEININGVSGDPSEIASKIVDEIKMEMRLG